MTVEDLEARYDYGCWANAARLKVVAQPTPEEFTQDVAGSHLFLYCAERCGTTAW